MVRQESIRTISRSLQIHKNLTVLYYICHLYLFVLDRVFYFSLVMSRGVIEVFFLSAAVVFQGRLIEFFLSA